MPLFESKESRMHRLFEKTFNQFNESLAWIPNDSPAPAIFAAVFNGASTAAVVSIQNCPSISQAWGKGSEWPAGALMQVFSLAMLRRVSRIGLGSIPLANLKNMAEIILNSIHSSKHPNIASALTEWANLNEQFNFDTKLAEESGPGPDSSFLVEEQLLRLQAIAACRVQKAPTFPPVLINLGELEFPLAYSDESWQRFLMESRLTGSRILGDPLESMSFRMALASAIPVMRDAYQENWEMIKRMSNLTGGDLK